MDGIILGAVIDVRDLGDVKVVLLLTAGQLGQFVWSVLSVLFPPRVVCRFDLSAAATDHVLPLVGKPFTRTF